MWELKGCGECEVIILLTWMIRVCHWENNFIKDMTVFEKGLFITKKLT
jgi:hypothetical protein